MGTNASDDNPLIIRQAQMEDLDSIMKLEQYWGEEGRAGEDKFVARLQKYPQGFFIARHENDSGLVASVMACPATYDKNDLSGFKNWFTATNNGFLDDALTPENAITADINALYVVSGIIDPDYRGGDVFSLMINRVVDLARTVGLQYVIAGAVIPGYRNYCEKHGPTNAYEYVSQRRGRRLIDPLMAMYEKIEFHVPDADHVIRDYFPDVSSLDYAALVVREV